MQYHRNSKEKIAFLNELNNFILQQLLGLTTLYNLIFFNISIKLVYRLQVLFSCL